MTKGLFIIGTDTGVGKTYVATGLAAALKQSGMNVGVMKPAETGCPKRAGQLAPGDALALMKAAGTRDPLSLVNPYRFSKPIAPAVAAYFAGKEISFEKIILAYQKLASRHEFMIVEGAGGLMVPLTSELTYLDLVEALELPVLIVARPGLGTINHTLLTISALLERNVPIAGIVINHATDKKSGLAERTSPAVIEELSGIEILGILPYGSRDFSSLMI